MDEKKIKRLKVLRLASGVVGATCVFLAAILSVGQLLHYFEASYPAGVPLLIIGFLSCLLAMVTNTKIRFAEEESADRKRSDL
ncbi:MAG: hypothetical protein HOC74_33345 [Gemmatimonadetes bacterium]|jgi:hypothetical protein|nr:hypothetical protein [Gemmatimonadota bacterium]